MTKIQRYYYDPNCNVIEAKQLDNNTQTHDELAIDIINKNPDFLNEYNDTLKKGAISESVFLVMKGYIYVGGTNENNMSAMYSSISLNQKTKNILLHLKEENYYIYDIIKNELTDEQKDRIRSWAKKGISRDEIRKRVIEEMIIPLAPVKNIKNDENKNIEKDIDER